VLLVVPVYAPNAERCPHSMQNVEKVTCRAPMPLEHISQHDHDIGV
jgi:hypothetical protein